MGKQFIYISNTKYDNEYLLQRSRTETHSSRNGFPHTQGYMNKYIHLFYRYNVLHSGRVMIRTRPSLKKGGNREKRGNVTFREVTGTTIYMNYM